MEDRFVDDWEGSSQATLTYGKKISEYGKFIIMEVLIYYAKNKRAEKEQQHSKLKLVTDQLLQSTEDINSKWERLISDLDVHSPEGVMAYALDTYGKKTNSLLFRTFYTFGKIKPLEGQHEWFDNFRLNGLCNGFNNVLWDDYGRKDCYAVGNTINGRTSRNFKPITSNECDDYRRICKILVGSLRKFIIRNDLYQTNAEYTIKVPTKGSLSYKEICDRCYQKYPFYWGGAHGCDFYLPQFKWMSITLMEARQFNDRYPSAIIGWIVNTTTYSSKEGGAHWIPVLAKDRNVYVVDSAAKALTNMRDGGAFLNKLRESGYSINFNSTLLQTDSYNCGLFSVISTYMMLCNDCNISMTAADINTNATGLVAGKTITSFRQVLAGSN